MALREAPPSRLTRSMGHWEDGSSHLSPGPPVVFPPHKQVPKAPRHRGALCRRPAVGVRPVSSLVSETCRLRSGPGSRLTGGVWSEPPRWDTRIARSADGGAGIDMFHMLIQRCGDHCCLWIRRSAPFSGAGSLQAPRPEPPRPQKEDPFSLVRPRPQLLLRPSYMLTFWVLAGFVRWKHRIKVPTGSEPRFMESNIYTE